MVYLRAMSKYSLTVMLATGMTDAAREKWDERLEKTVAALDGKVGKLIEMGRKQLAYRINNLTEATYRNWSLELPRESVIQLRKKLSVDKEILRYLLVAVEGSSKLRK